MSTFRLSGVLFAKRLMSANKGKSSVSNQEWQEMAALKLDIDSHMTTRSTEELERFTELFVATIKENSLMLVDT